MASGRGRASDLLLSDVPESGSDTHRADRVRIPPGTLYYNLDTRHQQRAALLGRGAPRIINKLR